MRGPSRIALLAAALLLSACGKAPAGDVPPGTVTDWPAYGATPGGTHFSRANQITPANVGSLEVAWLHRSGDIREAEFSEQRRITQSSLQHSSWRSFRPRASSGW